MYPLPESPTRLLAAYLKPQRWRVAALALLLLAGIGLQLANPQVIRGFLDATQSGQAGSGLALAGLAFIVIGLAQRGLSLAGLYLSETIGWLATNALRTDLVAHCVALDMPFHKLHTPGELIDRIDGDATALANFFSQLVLRVAGNGVLIVGILLLLFREDWRLGLGLTAYALVTLAPLAATQNLAVPRWAAERRASADLYGFLEEHLAGTEDLVANGAGPYVLNRLYRLLRNYLQAGRAGQMLSHFTYATGSLLALAGYALALLMAAYLYTTHALSLGAAYVVIYYVGMLSTPLGEIRGQAQDLGKARASISRIGELWAQHSALIAAEPAVALPAGPLPVTFDHVSFTYKDRGPREAPGEALSAMFLEAPAGATAAGGGAGGDAAVETNGWGLHDISFTLPAGRVLGLLGRTGSGKTTLTRLLVRLYDPDTGALRLGGSDLRTIDLRQLRGKVGLITQDVQLFNASVRDNLTLFDPSLSDEQIEVALRELGLWQWAQRLPAGLDTMLGAAGEEGVARGGLSAGEAQLLAFCRVFLKDPAVIALDEASSRLDPATERLLEQAIDRLLAGRTGIVIAHRLRTVQRADDILILEQGQIVELGARAELAADPASRFHRLLVTGMEEELA